MTMSVKLKAVQKVNPQNVAAPQKYYAQAVSTGRTDMNRLARLIAMQCTVNRADCLAVLSALQDNISMELEEGRIVELGELGVFQVSVKSMGHDAAQEVSSFSVQKAKLNFRPGTELKKMINNLKFRKDEVV
jgi:predicted histone-like DNA-binding protein